MTENTAGSALVQKANEMRGLATALFSFARWFGCEVDVTRQRVVKFLPSNPPRRGDHIFVDGARCRVTRAKVTWDSNRRWTLHALRVKDGR